jgi:prepilin-type N-terminal cleavage/methylation domain-containing protein
VKPCRRPAISSVLPAVAGTGPRMRARPGFTLLELMLVTVILSLLALVAAGPIGRARDRAMNAAARADMARAIRAVEFYQAMNHGQMPATVAELASADYTPGAQIQVCRFQRTDAPSASGRSVTMDLRHRGSPRGVTTTHPTWSGRIEDKLLPTCQGDSEPTPEPEQGTQPPPSDPPPSSGGNSILDLLRRLFGG